MQFESQVRRAECGKLRLPCVAGDHIQRAPHPGDFIGDVVCGDFSTQLGPRCHCGLSDGLGRRRSLFNLFNRRLRGGEGRAQCLQRVVTHYRQGKREDRGARHAETLDFAAQRNRQVAKGRLDQPPLQVHIRGGQSIKHVGRQIGEQMQFMIVITCGCEQFDGDTTELEFVARLPHRHGLFPYAALGS